MTIYKIMIDDQIVYVGKTKNIEHRFQQHRDYVRKWLEEGIEPDKMKLLYSELKDAVKAGREVTMSKIVDTDEMFTAHEFTSGEGSAMELAFIEYFQPRLNFEGVRGAYVFPRERAKEAAAQEKGAW